MTPKVIDSFCLDYTPVVQAPGDEKIVAPSRVKKRILGNELKYEGCPK